MNWKNDYRKKIHNIIIISYFFVFIICLMSIISYIKLSLFQFNIFINVTILFTLLFILIIYILEKFFFLYKADIKKNIYSYIFNFLLILIISLIFYNIADDNKILIEILFILPVITTAVSHGKLPAIFLAVLEGVYIVYNSKELLLENNFLDMNIIFIGILILTAWLIGSFFELEEKTKKNLENLANMDNLTGLCNHRYFQEKLNNEIKNKSDNLSLILINIDNFKIYNNMLGHQSGDEVLKKISSMILNLVSEKYTVARYGGDEFIILMSDTDSKQSFEIAEKIRKEVEKKEFAKENYLPNKKITVSIGVANYPQNVKYLDDILKAADESLYRAKYSYKNNVKLYYSVLEEIKNELDKDEGELISSLRTLLNIINVKDRYTYGHSERVMNYSIKVAEALKLDEEYKKILKYGAFLHDIGKIDMDREILTKPGKLTEFEMNIIKKHPVYGAAMVQPIKSLYGCIELILYHHENIDGSGYPEGIKGDEIPLGAKILRIVDSFDAMITDRPYKRGISVEDAKKELQKYAGVYYDKEIVEVFIELVEKEFKQFISRNYNIDY